MQRLSHPFSSGRTEITTVTTLVVLTAAGVKSVKKDNLVVKSVKKSNLVAKLKVRTHNIFKL